MQEGWPRERQFGVLPTLIKQNSVREALHGQDFTPSKVNIWSFRTFQSASTVLQYCYRCMCSAFLCQVACQLALGTSAALVITVQSRSQIQGSCRLRCWQEAVVHSLCVPLSRVCHRLWNQVSMSSRLAQGTFGRSLRSSTMTRARTQPTTTWLWQISK